MAAALPELPPGVRLGSQGYGWAKQRAPALRVAGQFGQIALAQHNRPGGLQPRHQVASAAGR